MKNYIEQSLGGDQISSQRVTRNLSKIVLESTPKFNW
jgi:hypothetical protein